MASTRAMGPSEPSRVTSAVPPTSTRHVSSIPSILREIFLLCESQPDSLSSLQNLRSSSRLFCDIASPILFHTLTVKKDLTFRRFLDFLSKDCSTPTSLPDRLPYISTHFKYLNLHIVPSIATLQKSALLIQLMTGNTLFPGVKTLSVWVEDLVALTGKISLEGEADRYRSDGEVDSDGEITSDEEWCPRYEYLPVSSKSTPLHRSLFNSLANPQKIVLGGPTGPCDTECCLLYPDNPLLIENQDHLHRVRRLFDRPAIQKISCEGVHVWCLPAKPGCRMQYTLGECTCFTQLDEHELTYGWNDYYINPFDGNYRHSIDISEIPSLPTGINCKRRMSRLMSAIVQDISGMISKKDPKGHLTTWKIIVDTSTGSKDNAGFRVLERLVCRRIRKKYPKQTMFGYSQDSKTISCFKFHLTG